MATVAGPRYAPEDPTLPKPWRGLVDGKTGYLYFWNPETNITQYERPGGNTNSGSAPQQRPSSTSVSSSVQVQESSQSQHRDHSYNDDDDRYNKSSNGGSKFASETRNYETGREESYQSQKVTNGDPNGGSINKGLTPSGVVNAVSPDAYRRQHEITVSGNNVPPPFTSFEATGLPSEFLREVRYLLQAGAKCRTLCHPLLGGIYFDRLHVMDQF